MILMMSKNPDKRLIERASIARENESGLKREARLATERYLLNQYSPVPRARSSTAGKDATVCPVGARAAQAQIYASLGREILIVYMV